MRDPMRIPGVLDELRATWEAQPDVSLPELWARLEARGVALNSSDSELADALRAERAAHPFSVSFSSSSSLSDATTSPSSVLIETEGSGQPQRVSVVFREAGGAGENGGEREAGENGEAAGTDGADGTSEAVEAWAVVRSGHASGAKSRGRRRRTNGRAGAATVRSGRAESPNVGQHLQTRQPRQPGLWRISAIKRCRAGEPLILVDENGVPHRLGVVKRLTTMDQPDDLRPALGQQSKSAVDLSGVRRDELEERVFLARLKDGEGTVVIGHALEIFAVVRREIQVSTLKWERLISAAEGAELVVRGLDGQDCSIGVVETLIRAE